MTEKSNKTAILVITAIGGFLAPFMSSSINVALPAISSEYKMNAMEIGWIATSYLLSAAVFMLPVGKIADIHGRKRIYSIGIAVFSIASILSTIMPSTGTFIAIRVIHGIAAAMIFSTGIAIVTSAFPPSEKGKVLGINVSATYLGLTVGPVIGGLLTSYAGWRMIFYLNVILGAITLVLISFKIKDEWADAKGEKFDLAGSLIYGVSITLTMYGFTHLKGLFPLLLICAGCAGILMFLVFESKIPNPIMKTELFFKNTVFAFSNAAALINYSATFGVGFLLSLYLQYVKGFDAHHAGLTLLFQPLIMAFLSPITGRLSDKIEPRFLASAGMAVTVIGLLSLSMLNPTSAIWHIISGLLIMGTGTALFSSPNTNAIMGSVSRRNYGTASSMVSTMRLLGQVLSMGMTMLVFSIFIGNVQINIANYGLLLKSLKTVFILFAVLSFAGIFFSLFRGNIHEGKKG